MKKLPIKNEEALKYANKRVQSLYFLIEDAWQEYCKYQVNLTPTINDYYKVVKLISLVKDNSYNSNGEVEDFGYNALKSSKINAYTQALLDMSNRLKISGIDVDELVNFTDKDAQKASDLFCEYQKKLHDCIAYRYANDFLRGIEEIRTHRMEIMKRNLGVNDVISHQFPDVDDIVDKYYDEYLLVYKQCKNSNAKPKGESNNPNILGNV